MSKKRSKIRILGMDYAIEDTPHALDAVGHRGQCEFEQCRILVGADLDDQIWRWTLLHEVLHGIDYRLSLGLSEDQIERLSTGLDTVMADNGGRLCS